MDEKIILQFKTTCPFPLVKYRVGLDYFEVRKASGVAYIILQILSNKSFGNDSLESILLSFGIPKDIHSVFGKEIGRLLKLGILESDLNKKYLQDPAYFGELRAASIRLTETGRTLFAEGSVPTGEKKAKSSDLFYSPVTRSFSFKSNLPYSPLSTTFLGEGFLDRVEIDLSGMEDFLKSNPVALGLKKEERIADFSYEEAERLNVRKEDGMEVKITPQGVDFSFATTDEKAFFRKYYSGALMSEGMLAKNKYRFMGREGTPLDIPSVDIGNFEERDRAYIPDDAARLASRPSGLFVSRGRIPLKGNKEALVLDPERAKALLDRVGENSEFLLVSKKSAFVFQPFKVVMPALGFDDKFELQMLVETECDSDSFEAIRRFLYEDCLSRPYDGDAGKLLCLVLGTSEDGAVLSDYVDRKLNEAPDEDVRVDILLSMERSFSKLSAWNSLFEDRAEAIMERVLSSLELDNVLRAKEILDPLRKKLSVGDSPFAEKFIASLKGKGSDEHIFAAMENAGFGLLNLLPSINLVQLYMSKALSREAIGDGTSLAQPYNVLSKNLWAINDMLGIRRYDDYSIRDDFPIEGFFNAYATLSDVSKKLERYRPFAELSYIELGKYMDIVNPIHEVFAREKDASTHPEKITEGYVDGLIARGKFKEAVCDLGVKLQFDLERLLDTDETRADALINMARKAKLIGNDEADGLHKLRMKRNDFLHPDGRNIAYGRADLEKWKELVFGLGKKEEEE